LVAAVGLMAFTAVAHAEGNWLIEGTSLKEKVEIEGEKDQGPYEFLVKALGFKLVFEKVKIDNGALLTGGEDSEELLFTEGKVYDESTGEWLKSCEVGDLNFKVKSHLILHNGKRTMCLNLPKAQC
jgi:hypothetical protein